MIFRNIVFAAVTAGIIAGLMLGALQTYLVTPTILAAEVFEIVDEAPAAGHGHGASHATTHAHNEEAWGPEDGAERTFYTVVADVVSGIGFALLLVSVMTLSGKATIKNGWLWGAAGFVVFFAAPGIGLTPEIPGMEAANLQGRQGWWLSTIALTGLGLGLIAFANIALKVGGALLLAVPHILGAPLPESHGFSHPDPAAVTQLENLATAFVQQTAIANGVFWLVLGIACAIAMKQFGLLDAEQE